MVLVFYLLVKKKKKKTKHSISLGRLAELHLEQSKSQKIQRRVWFEPPRTPVVNDRASVFIAPPKVVVNQLQLQVEAGGR